jgi:ATP-dependent exoDNAse (exonuclease V) alpha subunit
MHWSHIGLYFLVVPIEQIPIVLAFVLTINKCQGLTLSRVILGPFLHPYQQNPKKIGTLYVALSRVKSLVDLQVLEPLSHIVLKIFPTKKCSSHRKQTFTSFIRHCLMHMFASNIMGK